MYLPDILLTFVLIPVMLAYAAVIATDRTLPAIYDGMLECWRWCVAKGTMHGTSDKPDNPRLACQDQPSRKGKLCPFCKHSTRGDR